MKKVLSRLLSMSLAVMVAFGLMIVPSAVPVHADGFVCGSVKYAKKITLYAIEQDVNVYELKMGTKLKNAKSVKVTSSKKKVLEPFGYYKGEKNLYINARKAGSATLTVKVKKSSGTKTYKVDVKVKKGSVPFKSFKVGKKNITSKYKHTQYAEVKVANNSKQKISIKVKNGCKVKSIKCNVWNEKTEKHNTKTINNNSTIKVKKENTDLYISIYDKDSKITFSYYLYFA